MIGNLDSRPDLVWAQVQEFGVAERHFNELQHSYRKMASGWLLAYVAGVSFVITELRDEHLLASGVIVALSMAFGIGIHLLWTIDVKVYHKILLANYLEGIILEANHSWLPPFRTRTFGLKVRNCVASFYSLGLVVAMVGHVFACANVRHLAGSNDSAPNTLIAVAIAGFAISGYRVYRMCTIHDDSPKVDVSKTNICKAHEYVRNEDWECAKERLRPQRAQDR